MLTAITTSPVPINEPVLSYAPGTDERQSVCAALAEISAEQRILSSIINGKEYHGAEVFQLTEPHNHSQKIATIHYADAAQINLAIEAASQKRACWADLSFDARAAVFLKAADLLCGPYRAKINAATMLGQSKTVYQAEIDAACELADFWRFNVLFARQILEQQPESSPGVWNRVDYRPLDGFVAAISPFNFTSIAANLPCAPALMGNTCLWKPSETSALACQIIMDLLHEAGLPHGVINLVHAPGVLFGDIAIAHQELGGIHFTGSTATFQWLWRKVAENIGGYRCYPRLVGETGGKDFIFAHPSADVEQLAIAMVRGAFEYQGQKCSAASRAYIPKSVWGDLKARVIAETSALTMGDVTDFSNFLGAVIDRKAFNRLKGAIDFADDASSATILVGGGCDDTTGYFIEPTIIETTDPKFRLLEEELFGPVLTVYVYDDDNMEETLTLLDETSPYALTGAIFARDRGVIEHLSTVLRFTAGNFYINDKPTGAVVGQQPFGGGRASGTNDKAGSAANLMRWINPRTIKETFIASRVVSYPSVARD